MDSQQDVDFVDFGVVRLYGQEYPASVHTDRWSHDGPYTGLFRAQLAPHTTILFRTYVYACAFGTTAELALGNLERALFDVHSRKTGGVHYGEESLIIERPFHPYPHFHCVDLARELYQRSRMSRYEFDARNMSDVLAFVALSNAMATLRIVSLPEGYMALLPTDSIGAADGRGTMCVPHELWTRYAQAPECGQVWRVMFTGWRDYNRIMMLPVQRVYPK